MIGRMIPRSMTLAAAMLAQAIAAPAKLDVAIVPTFGERPLVFDTLAFALPENQAISVTRCDLLLSGAALQRADGTWIGAGNWSEFVSFRGERTRFSLRDIPSGTYRRLRFDIGLPPSLNQADPAGFPSDHPLNPLVNGMHWGWQGGYIFAAIEGLWKSPDSPVSGYSFHLANAGNVATVEIPVTLDLSADRTLTLRFDLGSVFRGITMTTGSSSTHSRQGDPIAATLKANLSRAFRLENVRITPSPAELSRSSGALIADSATPFPFRIPSGFPKPLLPGDNPLTREGVRLGERLFHDRALSGNGRQACVTCHRPEFGFSDRRRFSIGATGETGDRQSMPLVNMAWKSPFFWDGRATTLREQVLMPIKDPKEMHASLPEVIRHLSGSADYPPLFEAAFGPGEIDADRIARALEQFLLTLVSADSKFDRAMKGETALTPLEQKGAELFNTEFDPKRGVRGADCFHCHGGATFRSVPFANNGLGGEGPADPGLGKTTGSAGDIAKFAVPSLRDVALTAPYMHDGRFATLEQVIDHYDHGIRNSPTLDPNLAKHPDAGLGLTDDEKSALVAFLKTLTGPPPAHPPAARGFRRGPMHSPGAPPLPHPR